MSDYEFNVGDLVQINPNYPDIEYELDVYGSSGSLGTVYRIDSVSTDDVHFDYGNWHKKKWLIPHNPIKLGGE